MAVTNDTRSIADCDTPVKRRGYCYSHYMKWWRYGNPTWTRPKRRRNLIEQRFGELEVIAELDEGHWLCRCDCGRESRVRGWSLTSGGTTTCGDGPTHRRAEMVGYSAAHARARRDKGPAKEYTCTDCGSPAHHWSYTHADPMEVVGEDGCAYSLNSAYYVPRCVPCHKAFDLGRNSAKQEVDRG